MKKNAAAKAPRVTKKKKNAVLLSIFFGPFALLYTYQKNRDEFWLYIILCTITLGLFLPLAWIATIISSALRPAKYYQKIGQSFTKRTRILLLSIFGLLVGVLLTLIGIGVKNAVQRQRSVQAAAAANAQRLAADSLTISNLYNALNKERSGVGAPALATVTNLQTAAEQKCNDMITSNYFAYTNPSTNKESNSFVADNQGDYYFKYYVSSIYNANYQQTATDVIADAVKYQATNLNNPNLNSVGWATCQKPNATLDIVAMLAQVADRPVRPVVNNYYSQPSSPIYQPSVNCTSYTDFIGTVHTNCR